MKTEKKRGPSRVLWGVLYAGTFLLVFTLSALFKMAWKPWAGEFTVEWSDSVGTVYTDLLYGDGLANKFDLYLPADCSRDSCGLVVYLHAGGFTSGDKSDDEEMLKWLCSKGYVAAGINYTLFGEGNPDANIYTQSVEIRESIPYVVAEAERLGYHIDQMALSGGSAGHCLAMLYAYRDADTAPVPVRMVFGAVGPSSFYPEDWTMYGFDREEDDAKAAAAGLFSVMCGKSLTVDLFGTPSYNEAVKDVSALLWVDENTVPSLLAYGAHDKVQPYLASLRLDRALTEHGVPHDYIVFEHSGHGLQNDDKQYIQYMRKVTEYLNTYLPVR